MAQIALIDRLNPEQLAVVTAPRSNMLVIAGAGTGKTTVLVTRIAYLVEALLVPPRSILAVTFTNKAAHEMQERLAGALGREVYSLWACTFHALCAKILRNFLQPSGLLPGYTILAQVDSDALIKRMKADEERSLKYAQDDSAAVIKRLMPDAEGELKYLLDDADSKPAEYAGIIAGWKEKGLRPEKIRDRQLPGGVDALHAAALILYERYEQVCQTGNCVDFGELILRTVELLRRDVKVRGLMQRRFKEILVDEFQDTSALQFELLQLLSSPDSHMMAVGDDDQAIYGWRGADFRNLDRFRREMGECGLYTLVQNYRSTGRILDVANHVIRYNRERLEEKSLRTDAGEGVKVQIRRCDNPMVETAQVMAIIRDEKEQGRRLDDIAVLYRTTRQSAPLENELVNHGFNYVVYGGVGFFAREEVQDAVCYLRLIQNHDDDAALLRIINKPARKIGAKSVELLRAAAVREGISIFALCSALKERTKDQSLDKALRSLGNKTAGFVDLINDLTGLGVVSSLPELVDNVCLLSGLNDFYAARDEKERQKAGFIAGEGERKANLQELVNQAGRYVELDKEALGNPDALMVDPGAEEVVPPDNTLESFLANINLLSGVDKSEDSAEDAPERVQLMTLHSAKGLEFKTVIIVGFEKGLLPASFALKDGGSGIEEERRLAYVGITRARERLYLTYSDSRISYRSGYPCEESTGASVFLHEFTADFKGIKRDSRPYAVERIRDQRRSYYHCG